MAGFDQAGVDRADGDLVDARALDGEERVGLVGGPNGGGGPASARIGYQPRGQCWWRTSRRGSGWSSGSDAVQVAHLALEPPGGERDAGQARHRRVRSGRCASTSSTRRSGRAGDEQVDDAEAVVVLVRGHQGQAEPVRRAAPRRQAGGSSAVTSTDDALRYAGSPSPGAGGGPHRTGHGPPIRRRREAAGPAARRAIPSAASATRPHQRAAAVDRRRRRRLAGGPVLRSPGRGSSGCRCTVTATKTTTQQGQRDRDHPAQSRRPRRPGEAELAGEQAERGQARAGPGTRRRRSRRARDAGRAARGPRRSGWCRSADQDLPGAAEEHRLAEAVAQDVQQAAAIASGVPIARPTTTSPMCSMLE